MMNYKNFLYELSRQQHRVIYTRLTALDLQDNILDFLEGVVSSGSISLDGKSNNRRSINLTINISDTDTIKTYIWALKTKCKIEIGLNNSIDPNYEDIIWFNQGIFILTSFSSSYSINQIQTINLQGRDKMCTLDGSIGGILVAGGTFDSYDYTDERNYTEKNIKYPIKQIIQDLVHQFGNEPFHNIFIKDLDFDGMELLEYRDTKDLYLWRLASSPRYINGTIVKEQPCFKYDDDTEEITIDDSDIIYENLFDLQSNHIIPTAIYFNNNNKQKYYCTKISYGDTAGYQLIDLIYPDTLEAKAGESVTSILDKIIKNVLSNYEYFYDVDGHFIFQKKRSYDIEEFSSIQTDPNGSTYALSLVEAQQEEIAYTFSDFELITAFNDTPNIANLKNDFTVWGERSGVDGDKLPIHMRYAIDNYPLQYTTITVLPEEAQAYNQKYGLNILPQSSTTFIAGDKFYSSALDSTIDQGSREYQFNGIFDPTPYLALSYHVDWREILWQMQADYRKYGRLDNFEQKIKEANKNSGLYQNGKTGYEQYYMDIEGFLHSELYNFTLWSDILRAYGLSRYLGQTPRIVRGITLQEIYNDLTKHWELAEGDESYQQDISEWSAAFQEVLNKLNASDFPPGYSYIDNYYLSEPVNGDDSEWQKNDKLTHFLWNKKVFEAPNQLNFWIDFMSGDSELMDKAGVPKIQQRPKVETNNDVKAIDYAKVPNIIYCKDMIPSGNKQRSNYSYLHVGNKIDQMFTRSVQGLSAKEAIQDMVYNYAQTAEAVSITCIPIYHLEPNIKIHIDSDEYDIHDDYVIQSMTIPLAYNGTMSISATKARKRIF